MSFSAQRIKQTIQATILASFIAPITIPLLAAPASCPSPIPFGLTTALTGNLALPGTQARNGVEYAVDEINKSGGIAGNQIALATNDTGASSTDALNAMNRIVEGKPLIIFGSMISPHVFAQT